MNKNHNYEISWLTSQIAVGHAPMSYQDLDDIKAQGINAIVNLCGEFCDLHTLEENFGFEVFYLPIPDECAPDMEEMETALEWLDESIFLNKKILIHCRHGHGRTGTFVSAYMLRRGMDPKQTEERLTGYRPKPTNHSQWKLLDEFHKKSGKLKIKHPSIDNCINIDLDIFFNKYQSLIDNLEQHHIPENSKNKNLSKNCCFTYFELQLVESLFLVNIINKKLSSESRLSVIGKANWTRTIIKSIKKIARTDSSSDIERIYNKTGHKCPLLQDNMCTIFNHRPIYCRINSLPTEEMKKLQEKIADLSQEIFFKITKELPPANNLSFSLCDIVSGKYVQKIFDLLR